MRARPGTSGFFTPFGRAPLPCVVASPSKASLSSLWASPPPSLPLASLPLSWSLPLSGSLSLSLSFLPSRSRSLSSLPLLSLSASRLSACPSRSLDLCLSRSGSLLSVRAVPLSLLLLLGLSALLSLLFSRLLLLRRFVSRLSALLLPTGLRSLLRSRSLSLPVCLPFSTALSGDRAIHLI